MKDYKVNIKVILKSDLLQSGKNKKDVEEKISRVIMDSIKNNKVMSSIFVGKYDPKIRIVVTKYDNKK